MGLASALTTALSGLTAAEAKIDVVGNNLANSQTVGFKESDVTYSTQFLQTLSLGSAPSASNGGTNPRQFGLGTQVSSIAANHSQGTIELSSNATDMAIQGDGMFIVEGNGGEAFYTRTGIFNPNANNELIAPDGNRLLGYGVDADFNIQSATGLIPLRIPLGTTTVAQATTQVTLEGSLPPNGPIATVAGVLESQVLGDSSIPQANATGMTVSISMAPKVNATTIGSSDGGGSHAEGVAYQYKFVYVDSAGTEGTVSSPLSITTPVGNGLADNSIAINALPAPITGYDNLRVYRTAADGSEFFRLTDLGSGATSFTDTNAIGLSTDVLNQDALNGTYNYVVTFSTAGQPETLPTSPIGPLWVVDSRIQIQNLPTPPVPGADDNFPAYDTVNIYRTTKDDPNTFYLVGTGVPGENFTDNSDDSTISDLTIPGNREANLNGPAVNSATLLTNVVVRNGTTYKSVFPEGTLNLALAKGGRTADAPDFEITSTTTLAEFTAFLEAANGIVRSVPGGAIPSSLNLIAGESGTLPPGISLVDGKIRIVSNNGEANSINISNGGLRVTTAGSNQSTISGLSFGSVQDAVGVGAVTDFVAYDSLGITIAVRVTAVLESQDGGSTRFRWFAESSDNQSISGFGTNVGTGLISIDGEGNVLSVDNSKVSIQRETGPSLSPLDFDINFNILSGLAADAAYLTAAQQDGAGPGTLSNYSINRDGSITGLFSNGSSRPLGQIVLAVFSNPQGLIQRGQNLYSNGVNAGVSLRQPGVNGGGELISGALELSNTDIGRNLIDLSLASTLYRGSSRVITTTQTLLDELLNLRR